MEMRLLHVCVHACVFVELDEQRNGHIIGCPIPRYVKGPTHCFPWKSEIRVPVPYTKRVFTCNITRMQVNVHIHVHVRAHEGA